MAGSVNRGSGPLAGVRVVELAAVISGPLAAMWLADQGAEVVKIETPDGGDTTRSSAAAPELHGMAGLFVNSNRGKRSVAVDITTEDGRAIVLDLCRHADVLIQNWRPGVLDRLGLGYDAVAAINTDIIYVSISGFGPDGPYAQRRAYDPIIQGLTGHVAVQCNPEVPIPDLVRTLVCDKATALIAAQSICAALYARERGAGGQHLEIPMLDSALAFFFPDGYMARSLLDDERRETRPTMSMVYRVAPTLDGHLITHTSNVTQMHALFRALGRPEWSEDPRFSTAVELRRHGPELGPMLAAALESFPTAELITRLEAEQVPFAPVLTLDEVPDDRQVRHNRIVRTRRHPVAGRILEAGPPARFSRTPTEVAPLAPMLGEHTDEVLRELGRTAEVDALRQRGVIA